MTFRIIRHSIITVCVITPNMTTLSITIKKCATQQNDTQHDETQYKYSLRNDTWHNDSEHNNKNATMSITRLGAKSVYNTGNTNWREGSLWLTSLYLPVQSSFFNYCKHYLLFTTQLTLMRSHLVSVPCSSWLCWHCSHQGSLTEGQGSIPYGWPPCHESLFCKKNIF